MMQKNLLLNLILYKMTTETKKKEFDRLMDAFRTEWFIYQDNQDSPRNINQINTISKQIINLNLTQQSLDESKQ